MSSNKYQVFIDEMAQNCEPPSFLSETKTYSEYKDDLERWSRLSGLDKKLQAEMVVHRLDGHPSRIKEKIVTNIGSSLVGNADGVKELIKFLDSVYPPSVIFLAILLAERCLDMIPY